jgi:hypothetical protein
MSEAIEVHMTKFLEDRVYGKPAGLKTIGLLTEVLMSYLAAHSEQEDPDNGRIFFKTDVNEILWFSKVFYEIFTEMILLPNWPSPICLRKYQDFFFLGPDELTRKVLLITDAFNCYCWELENNHLDEQFEKLAEINGLRHSLLHIITEVYTSDDRKAFRDLQREKTKKQERYQKVNERRLAKRMALRQAKETYLTALS